MKKVRLFSDFESHDFLLALLKRQTKGFIGNCYKNLEFVNGNHYSYSVSFNYPASILSTPPQCNFCFVMEPPEILPALQLRSLEQIGHYYTPVDSCLKQLGIRGKKGDMVVLLHTGIDESPVELEKKSRKMSMIVSVKTKTPYQMKRFELFKALLQTPLDIDFFGRDLPRIDPRVKGELPSLNKSTGLKHYQFSIACENTSHLGCISEKFYDCIVNNCIPITNAPGANVRFNQSCVYLDFEKPTQELVQKISEVYNWDRKSIKQYQQPLSILKERVLSGDLSVANRIAEAVNSV